MCDTSCRKPPHPDSLFFNMYYPPILSCSLSLVSSPAPLLFVFFFHRRKPKSTICKGSLMLMFGAGFICIRQHSSPVKQSDTLTRVRLLGEPPDPSLPLSTPVTTKKEPQSASNECTRFCRTDGHFQAERHKLYRDAAAWDASDVTAWTSRSEQGPVIQRAQNYSINGPLLYPSQPLSSAFEMEIVGITDNNRAQSSFG